MLLRGTLPVYLTDFSPSDKPWDKHRSEADSFRDLYQGTYLDCYAGRIKECSVFLGFGFEISETTRGVKLRLQSAKFCRVRHCPVCQWRRSLMWRARFFKVLPKILDEHPTARFIFLTLTVKNCEVENLRTTLAWMNKSWQRLTERKQWPALGFVKAVEVTRGADDTAHPHFHALLMVGPGYFSGHSYLSQERWTELWESCLRVNYTPVVDVRAIRPRRGTPEAQIPADLVSAITETLKYSVKPSDVLKGDDQRTISDKDWLVALTNQLHKTRAIATGGVLKSYLANLLEEEPADLIHAEELSDSETESNAPRVHVGWREKAKRYQCVDADYLSDIDTDS